MVKIDEIVKNYFSSGQNIEKIATAVASLSDSDQMSFLISVMRQLGEEQKIKWAEKVTTIAYGQQWKDIENWMDGVFSKNMSKTPKEVAVMAVYYFKVSKKMLPKFILLAQKVKQRLAMRKKRSFTPFKDRKIL